MELKDRAGIGAPAAVVIWKEWALAGKPRSCWGLLKGMLVLERKASIWE
jgi:hypothetical protein